MYSFCIINDSSYTTKSEMSSHGRDHCIHGLFLFQISVLLLRTQASESDTAMPAVPCVSFWSAEFMNMNSGLLYNMVIMNNFMQSENFDKYSTWEISRLCLLKCPKI